MPNARVVGFSSHEEHGGKEMGEGLHSPRLGPDQRVSEFKTVAAPLFPSGRKDAVRARRQFRLHSRTTRPNQPGLRTHSLTSLSTSGKPSRNRSNFAPSPILLSGLDVQSRAMQVAIWKTFTT